MRVFIEQAFTSAPFMYLSQHYAPKLVGAGVEFSKAGYQHSLLTLREFEGARARTALINGCNICQAWRSARDLPGYFGALGGSFEDSVAKHGPAPDEAFYTHVKNWPNASMLSLREALAIEYAEKMGTDPQALAQDEALWQQLKAEFSDEEIVDLTFCIAAWIGLGRATHVLGLDGVCSIDALAAR